MFSLPVALLLLGVRAAIAHDPPTSPSQIQFTCPVGDQAIQAYAPLCPLTLSDGSGNLNSKILFIAFYGSPGTYQTTRDADISIRCSYDREYFDPGKTCEYVTGAGTYLRLATDPEPPSTCPLTPLGGGANPKPSPGGYFRKRSGPKDVQEHQPSFVCPQFSPLTGSLKIYLENTLYAYEPIEDINNNQLACGYVDDTDQYYRTYFTCNYNADSGAYVPGWQGAVDDRCATTACPSAQYVQSRRKRTLADRQVKAADLRTRVAAPAGPSVPKRRSAKWRVAEARG